MFRPQIWVRYTKKNLIFAAYLYKACVNQWHAEQIVGQFKATLLKKTLGLAGLSWSSWFSSDQSPSKTTNPDQLEETQWGLISECPCVSAHRLSQISIQHGYTLPSDSALLLSWRLIERSLSSLPSPHPSLPLCSVSLDMPYIPDGSLKHTSVNMHFDVLQWDLVGMCVTVAVLPGALVLSLSLSLPLSL